MVDRAVSDSSIISYFNLFELKLMEQAIVLYQIGISLNKYVEAKCKFMNNTVSQTMSL